MKQLRSLDDRKAAHVLVVLGSQRCWKILPALVFFAHVKYRTYVIL